MNTRSISILLARPTLVYIALAIAVVLLAATASRVSADDVSPMGQEITIATQHAMDEDSNEQVGILLIVEPTPTATPSLMFVAVVADDEEPDVVADTETRDEPKAPEAPALEIAGPPTSAEEASLIVHRRMCDTFVDEIADDVDAIAAACPDPFKGEIGIVPTLLLNINGVTTPAFGGATQDYEWSDLTLGTYSLGGETPAGFSDQPIVHCRVDVGNSPWQRYPAAHHGITIDVSVEGAAVLCDWYEVPAPLPLSVQARICPLGVESDEVDLTVLSATCLSPLSGHEFELDLAGATHHQLTIEGQTTWEGLPPDPVLVKSPHLPGYGEPVVFCAPDDGMHAFGFPLTVVDGAFDLDLGNYLGVGATCRWFAIPWPGAIAVTKWLCPTDYDLAAPAADPATDCATLFDGAQFHFEDGVGLWPMAITGEDGPGTFMFSGLDPGVYTITEVPSPHIVAHDVACAKSIPSENPMLGPALGAIEPPVVDESIELDLSENETIQCDWYNVPTDNGEGGDSAGEDDGDGQNVPDDGGGSDGSDADDDSGVNDDSGSADGELVVTLLPNTGVGPAIETGRGPNIHLTLLVSWLVLLTIGQIHIVGRVRPTPAPATGHSRRQGV